MFRFLNIILILMFFIINCRKEKRYSNRLDEKSWKLTTTIDGQEGIDEDDDVILTFNECDIYDESCLGKWSKGNYSSEFYWQFTSQGKEFIISNKTQTEIHASTPEQLLQLSVIQTCYNYSGSYDVKKFKKGGKDILKLRSETTSGYSGKVVEIELQEQ